MQKNNQDFAATDVLLRDNQASLYEQIATRLREEIAAGNFFPSGRLPSEAELGMRFDVSRITVRQALAKLVKEGLVIRRQGKGSYTSDKPVRHGLDTLRSFHESLVQQGLNASMELIEKERLSVPESLKSLFGADNTQSLFLKRLHRVDGEPVALGCSYLPVELDLCSWSEIEKNPAYALLASAMECPVARADISIRAQSADRGLAAALNISIGAALLMMVRTSYFVNGRFAEYSTFYIRPERYEFVLGCEYKE
ncbi:GntR family transcriptional regulator [Candidatus Methylospira mobilis]|uniref:GntR family transcriptional regulator n=1 Tax=Candidatus Methylospira mobilis TaxID=1808979 RepID=A0A5Q0BL07_9GAMM|nr:GntR family transcriptional regulator [Candidatus Methylospira mobilis]QFY44523.1 GntR family transcriptional regulator [Candidatus Methylospira mobilis]WNV06047.1 GntR family transcriptional regulator [Candidatus Methylospira mobilis]